MAQGDPADIVTNINSTIPNQSNLYPTTNANVVNPSIPINTTPPTNANANLPPGYVLAPPNTQPAFVQQQGGNVQYIQQPGNVQYIQQQPGNVQYVQQQGGNVQYVQANPNPNAPQVVYQVPPGFPQGNATTPQIIYVQAPPNVVYVPVVAQTVRPKGPYFSMVMASYVLYIFAVTSFIFPCDLPSIILSLVLVRKRIIHRKNRDAVLACSIIGLIAWVFFPCFIWYSAPYCYQEQGDDDDGSDGSDGSYYSSVNETTCYDMWYGWIALVVWYVCLLAFGIPRMVYTYTARFNHPEKI